MKLTIDYTNKTIEIIDDINVEDFLNIMVGLKDSKEYKIIKTIKFVEKNQLHLFPTIKSNLPPNPLGNIVYTNSTK